MGAAGAMGHRWLACTPGNDPLHGRPGHRQIEADGTQRVTGFDVVYT